MTQEEVAERAGVYRNTISGYETGRVRPSTLALNMLATIYGKHVEWFYGEEATPQGESGRVKAPESAAPSKPDALDANVSLDEIHQDLGIRIDRLESYVRAAVAESRTQHDPSHHDPSDRSPVRLLEFASAAGVGAEVYDETPVGLLWFRNDWLQSHSIDPEQSNIISVQGPSMEPTLPDGCKILVDRKRREPHEDRIYVMRTEEGLVVKRLGWNEKGRWELLSDNPDWEPVIMSYETDIVGEVRWVARTL